MKAIARKLAAWKQLKAAYSATYLESKREELEQQLDLHRAQSVIAYAYRQYKDRQYKAQQWAQFIHCKEML